MGWYFIRLKTSSNGKAPEGVYFMLFISIKEAFPKQGRFLFE
jgi:hypothetical protein